MSATSANDDRDLQVMISKLLEGELDDASQEILLRRLQGSDADRDAWIRAIVTHADLGLCFNPPRGFSSEELLVIAAQQSDAGRLDQTEDLKQPIVLNRLASRSRLWSISSAIGFATAAGLLVATSMGLWPDADRNSLTIAKISSSDTPAEIWVGEITQSIGSDLSNLSGESARLAMGQTLEFSKGLVECRINGGVTLVARGPSRLKFVDRDHVWLDFGRVSATVDEGYQGFCIATKHAVVTDLGTSFSVNEDRTGSSFIEVHSGEVDVRGRSSNSDTNRINQGQAVRVSSGEDATQFVSVPASEAVPVLSLQEPHLRLLCDQDAYVTGGESSAINRGTSHRLWVKTDWEPTYTRMAYTGFDFSQVPVDRLVAARLILTVDPNDYAQRREPTNKESDTDWWFAVNGLWDTDEDHWSESRLVWDNAPGRDEMSVAGGSVGPSSPDLLAHFAIHGHGVAGDKVVIESRELLDFLRADDNDRVTLIISRKTGCTWKDGQGDRVVHSFSSKERKSFPPPTLELWFEDESKE